ncbi:MAG: uroporphyrinogen-III C-methyltransferase [Alphaproteobacteria bacterium]|nr:uroporphyrinogen-III C-methyltransferase [Alphaproteobacteria bacterium]
MSRVPNVAPAVGGGSLMVAWQLRGRSVLVVGGGSVAAGRVRLALEADARVRVVAPALGAELRHRWSLGEVAWRPAPFEAADLDDVDLVLACLDDEDVSATIADACRARRIPVNCADQPERCDFWLTSVHRDGPLQIALSTNGEAPALGARLLRELARHVPADARAAIEAFGTLRQRVRAHDPAPDASRRRMRWLTDVARRSAWRALATLDGATVDHLLDAYDLPGPSVPRAPELGPRHGRIRLVGAGPGDPDLLTVAARRALDEADLVLSDRLVPQAILDLVRGELRVASKQPGRADAAQAELDAWMVEAALGGRDVVRLKCGDPFVFGRGGEELDMLARHGLHAEVIPGVTSALAAPLAAGIPATQRGVADRVLVMTGQGRGGSDPALPAFDPHTTCVWLMGVGRLAALADALCARGFPADWPAALVERATHPDERVVTGTIATIAARARAHGVGAPATLVVGQVVAAAQAREASRPAARASVAVGHR